MLKFRIKAAEGGSLFRSWSIGAILLMVAALLLASCGEEQGEQQQTQEEDGESAGPNVAVSISDITADPSEYYGERVTVSGLVTDKLDSNSFAIGGDDLFGDQALPVVSAEPLDQVVQDSGLLEESDGDVVQVTGTVRDLSDINDDEVASDLSDDVFSIFEDQAALVADTAVVTPASGQQGGGTQPAETPELILSEITDDPSEYYGQTVTVTGPIGRIVEANVFAMVSEQALEGSDLDVDIDTLTEQGVLVSGGGDLDVSEGQNVRVTGEIQPFDFERFDEASGSTINEDSDVFSAWSANGGRPAIIADSVEAAN